jgi:hypothetical protein
MDLLEPSFATNWKRFRRRYLRPWRTVSYGDIQVYYKKHLDGGGSWFGQDYIPFLKACGMPKQARLMALLFSCIYLSAISHALFA